MLAWLGRPPRGGGSGVGSSGPGSRADLALLPALSAPKGSGLDQWPARGTGMASSGFSSCFSGI